MSSWIVTPMLGESEGEDIVFVVRVDRSGAESNAG